MQDNTEDNNVNIVMNDSKEGSNISDGVDIGIVDKSEEVNDIDSNINTDTNSGNENTEDGEKERVEESREVKKYTRKYSYWGDNSGGGRKRCGVILVSLGDNTLDTKLLVVRGLCSGIWSLPKGKIDNNESEEICATRELYEETGIKLDSNSLVKLPKIKIGNNIYYILYTDDILYREFKIHDVNEIDQVLWKTLEELHTMVCNKDIRAILKNPNLISPRKNSSPRARPRTIIERGTNMGNLNTSENSSYFHNQFNSPPKSDISNHSVYSIANSAKTNSNQTINNFMKITRDDENRRRNGNRNMNKYPLSNLYNNSQNSSITLDISSNNSSNISSNNSSASSNISPTSAFTSPTSLQNDSIPLVNINGNKNKIPIISTVPIPVIIFPNNSIAFSSTNPVTNPITFYPPYSSSRSLYFSSDKNNSLHSPSPYSCNANSVNNANNVNRNNYVNSTTCSKYNRYINNINNRDNRDKKKREYVSPVEPSRSSRSSDWRARNNL